MPKANPAPVIDDPVAVRYAQNAALENPAVARCCAAWERRYEVEMVNGEQGGMSEHYANESYCDAMPTLCGEENIRDFIACVAHGLLVGSICEDMGSKLLYAAQVVLGALRRGSNPQKTRSV